MKLEIMLKEYRKVSNTYPGSFFPDIDMIYNIEERIASPFGEKELLRLNDEQTIELWKLALNHRRFVRFPEFRHHSFPRISTSDTHEEIEDYSCSSIIINRLLKILPNSLLLKMQDNRPLIRRVLALGYKEDEGYVPAAVASQIIEMNPSGVVTQKQDAYDGQVLLHMMMVDGKDDDYGGISYQVTQKVFRTNPEAAMYQTNQGETPLHVAARTFAEQFKEDWRDPLADKVEYMAWACPAAAGVVDNKGYFPITHLLYTADDFIFYDDKSLGSVYGFCDDYDKGMLKALKMLHEAYPNFVRLPMFQAPSLGKSKRSPPLLYLTKYSNYDNPLLLLFLIHAMPQDIFKADEEGYTPLEYFYYTNERSQDFLEYIEINQGSTTFQYFNDILDTFHNMRDVTNGENVLHLFSKVKATCCPKFIKDRYYDEDDCEPYVNREDVFKGLIALSPELLMDLNSMGNSPLHLRLLQEHGNETLLEEVKVASEAMTKMEAKKSVSNPAVTMHEGLMLYPFMIVASKKNPCLSTIYFLLQTWVTSNNLS